MKAFRAVCFGAGVVLVLGFAGVFAQLEGQLKVDLRFEESEVVRRVEQDAIRLEEKPSFVGEVYFKAPGIPTTQGANQTVRRIPKGSDFLAAAIGGPVSVESKLYLMNLRNIGEDFSLRSEPNDVGVWSVYGRSREEVEAVARTALEQLNKKAYEKLERAKRDLERSKERVSSLEKEVAALLEEREVLPGKFKELREKVRYEDVKGAQASVDEGLKALQLVEIEIAGIRAKREELERHMGLESWAELRAALEIELAGAMARKEAAEGFVQRGKDYISWQSKLAELPNLLPNMQALLDRYVKRDIPQLERDLTTPGWDMRPVELTRQTVLIHPLEFE